MDTPHHGYTHPVWLREQGGRGLATVSYSKQTVLSYTKSPSDQKSVVHSCMYIRTLTLTPFTFNPPTSLHLHHLVLVSLLTSIFLSPSPLLPPSPSLFPPLPSPSLLPPLLPSLFPTPPHFDPEGTDVWPVPLVVRCCSGQLHQHTAGCLCLPHCTEGLHSLAAMGLKEEREGRKGTGKERPQ